MQRLNLGLPACWTNYLPTELYIAPWTDFDVYNRYQEIFLFISVPFMSVIVLVSLNSLSDTA